MPVAVTVNVAALPARTVCDCGCDAMAGATGAAVTVSVNNALVTVPAVFETTTSNAAPLSASVVAAIT